MREPIWKMPIAVRYSDNGEVAFWDDPNPDGDGRVGPAREPSNFPERWGRQLPQSVVLQPDFHGHIAPYREKK